MFLFSRAVKLAGKHLRWHIFQKSSQLLPMSESRQLCGFYSLELIKKFFKKKASKKDKQGNFQTKNVWSVWKCLQALERKRRRGESTSYQQRRISSGHGPPRNRCSSSCSPHCGACQTSGPIHTWDCLQCTDLMVKNSMLPFVYIQNSGLASN